jgi:4-hydroxy-3-methylbut-2-enyl diphosphate reductase IspH
MGKSFKDESRINWVSDHTGNLTQTEIELGCMMRIADALETIAKNHDQMENEICYLKERKKVLEAHNTQLCRSNAALRGYLGRLKKKGGQ